MAAQVDHRRVFAQPRADVVLVSPVIGILLLHVGRREARERFPESAHDAFPCPLREPDDPTSSDDPEHLVHRGTYRHREHEPAARADEQTS